MSSQISAELWWCSRWCSWLHSHAGWPLAMVHGIMIATASISVYRCTCELWPQSTAIPVVNTIAECSCKLCCDVFVAVFVMAFHHGKCSCDFRRNCLRLITFTIVNAIVECHCEWRWKSWSRSPQSWMPMRNTITILWMVGESCSRINIYQRKLVSEFVMRKQHRLHQLVISWYFLLSARMFQFKIILLLFPERISLSVSLDFALIGIRSGSLTDILLSGSEKKIRTKLASYVPSVFCLPMVGRRWKIYHDVRRGQTQGIGATAAR
jgi:hypothetical protein